jgi:hypothetical protein
MPLPTLHAFVCIIAANATGFLGGLDALVVHDGGAWIREATDMRPLGTVQGGIKQMVLALQAEATEMIQDRLPWVGS